MKMIQKLSKKTAFNEMRDKLALNKIQRDVQKLAKGSESRWAEIVSTLNSDLQRAMEQGEVR
jgi:hypothetical protein